MCEFFSFVTEPNNRPNERFYFDWNYRKDKLSNGGDDSHSHICCYHGLDEDICNKYEYNPLIKKFKIDQINSEVDDRVRAEEWVRRLDFKRVVKPLIVKLIICPFEIQPPEIDEHVIELLKQGASVGASVWANVWDSVRANVWDSVRANVWNSVWDSVRANVWNSVWNSVRASVRANVWNSVRASVGVYALSFFDIEYEYDFTPAIKLWEMGLIPLYDGTMWRLHGGKDGGILYKWTPEKVGREL